jgi:hypothetical protein
VPVLDRSGDRGYHAPEVVQVGVLLLRELLDALYGAEPRDLGRLIADLTYLIRVAEESAWPPPEARQ